MIFCMSLIHHRVCVLCLSCTWRTGGELGNRLQEVVDPSDFQTVEAFTSGALADKQCRETQL